MPGYVALYQECEIDSPCVRGIGPKAGQYGDIVNMYYNTVFAKFGPLVRGSGPIGRTNTATL